MDFQIPLVFVSVFSLASVVLVFIFKFGIKEKSYEEALAEQRQQSHVLLGNKPKSKDKKNKKVGKKEKSKDKPIVQVENPPEAAKKPSIHVEFNEEVEEVVQEPVSVKANTNKKQSKKDKVRPILVNKESEVEEKKNGVNKAAQPVLNHFEETQPKDDFELYRSNGEDVTVKEEVCVKPTTKPAKVSPEPPKTATIYKKQPIEVASTPAPTPKDKSISAISAPIPAVNGFASNSGKEKKKKKSEFNALQQLAGDTAGLSFLLDMVRKVELTRSEVQILIDLLLNKQHEAPVILDEWSEGKSDPIQKLKKQLAEKEKLLTEEQELSASTKAKLRDIRAESQTEKNILQQKIRSLEELARGKQVEVSQVQQQLQQIQTQLNAELAKNHNLLEEFNALQMQRQQFEIRIAQAQESDAAVGQLRLEIQELSTINSQLHLDLNRLSEENASEKERQQNLLGQLTNFQKDLEHHLEANLQLKEKIIESEHNLQNILNQNDDLKLENTKLSNGLKQEEEEVRKLNYLNKQAQDELQRSTDEHVKVINQLKSEVIQLQDENQEIKASKVNGSIEESKQNKIQVTNLLNEIESLKSELNKTALSKKTEITNANQTIKKLQVKVDELETLLEDEKTKVEEQITKNNELRQKNWKVIEALNAAENRLKSSLSNIQSKSESEIEKAFIRRLFPDIKEVAEPEVCVKEYLDKIRKDSGNSAEVKNLKSQLQHYKGVIDRTEEMLNKLQKHIEQEEINWQVKETHSLELKQQVTNLELQLKDALADKKKVLLELQVYKSESSDSQQINAQNGLH